ncbi:MAG: SCO family protein [Nitrospira sp.]|jgi:protein SCO1/2|nr:SCO family protein [Nitrospira sp.]
MMKGVFGLVFSVWILSGGMVARAEMKTPTIPDIEMTDQDGGTHRLYSDLIKGKTVAITFLYTSCKTSCPAMTGLFRAVQQKLQAGSHRPVSLLSISLDPVTDRPAQLKAIAQRFSATPGWYFLTGTYPDVVQVLSALNAAGPQLSDHPSMILVGNDATGQWTRHYGLASVPMVMDLIDSVTGSMSHR